MHMRRRAGEGLNGAHLAKGGAESMTFDPKPGDWREVQNGYSTAAVIKKSTPLVGVIT